MLDHVFKVFFECLLVVGVDEGQGKQGNESVVYSFDVNVNLLVRIAIEDISVFETIHLLRNVEVG